MYRLFWCYCLFVDRMDMLISSSFSGSEWVGGDGLQGGELRGLHDGGEEARSEGVCVDHVQEQGGVGEQH